MEKKELMAWKYFLERKALLDKHRIVGSIDPKNTSSFKLFEHLGFRKETHFHKSLLINREWVDDIVYAILRV